MSDYKRMVSYLYVYDKGIKGKNVGFVKTERKNGQVKLQLQMNGVAGVEKAQVNKVNLLVKTPPFLLEKGVGSVTVKNGVAAFKMTCTEDTIGDTLENIAGIYVAKDENAPTSYISIWDDMDFNVEMVKTAKQIENIRELASKNAEKNEKAFTAGAANKAENIPVWERPIKSSVFITREELDSDRANEEPVSALSVSEVQPESKIDITKFEMPQLLEYYMAKYDKHEIFCDDDVYDCVDIDIEDIKAFPEDYRGLAENSFLNHGYFSFRHLLIAKEQKGFGEYTYVIGVPGVYNRRERVTASMFGFERFKFSMRSDVHVCHFGYWLKELA